MSGKRRLSSTGKWLLDSSGKAKICTCCGCPCLDKCYSIVFGAAVMTPCDGDCDELQTYVQDYFDALNETGVLVEITAPCGPGYINGDMALGACGGGTAWTYSVELFAEGECPTEGTADYDVNVYYNDVLTCTGTISATITETFCCACPDACWRWTITAVPAYAGDCPDCVYWNDGGVYLPTGPWYECLGPCVDPYDFGFPVSYCWDGENLYLRASLETAPPCADETCCPFYIGYSRATPIPLTEEGCPEDGTYLLDLDPLYDGLPCDIPQITVKIERVNCCETVDPATYYLSCDVVFTRHEDVGGGITNCDGTGGTETCNTTATITDTPMNSVIACSFESDDSFNCYFPDEFYNPTQIYLTQIAGVWHATFGTNPAQPEQETPGPTGLTPVGIYDDVTLCWTDGFIAYNLSITNIVVTT